MMRHHGCLMLALLSLCLIAVSCAPAVEPQESSIVEASEETAAVPLFTPEVIITRDTVNLATPLLPSPQVLPYLSDEHAGWKDTRCELCHDLPPPDHNTAVTWECAACHGGNGACKPNGVNITTVHNRIDPCIQCHQEVHGFTQKVACATCHFASAGTIDCSLGSGESNTVESHLLPVTLLNSSCINWPDEPISANNRATRFDISLKPGNAAVDFTLKDVDGSEVTLSTLLKNKPVLLVLGSYTCTRYRESIPLLNQLAATATTFDPTLTYADAVYFVHVNVIEAAPEAPDLSPYTARVEETPHSSVRQPQTYTERLALSRSIRPLLEGTQLLLVDELNHNALNNPLWCTYGPSSHSAFLIRPDGIIQAAQLWLDVETMKKAIEKLLENSIIE